ncbi:hypothetical protein TNCV_4721701 [Trichonephila clavipes]|uniref:Uncharacterized protein n=1 Tax=Trichonephila clavipes TaxID=2585209 RepID=A0A8X7BG16_TRICX|nr:hypothetical protein TNCV_4721701 [Trichonephila clavipes]
MTDGVEKLSVCAFERVQFPRLTRLDVKIAADPSSDSERGLYRHSKASEKVVWGSMRCKSGSMKEAVIKQGYDFNFSQEN